MRPEVSYKECPEDFFPVIFTQMLHLTEGLGGEMGLLCFRLF